MDETLFRRPLEVMNQFLVKTEEKFRNYTSDLANQANAHHQESLTSLSSSITQAPQVWLQNLSTASSSALVQQTTPLIDSLAQLDGQGQNPLSINPDMGPGERQFWFFIFFAMVLVAAGGNMIVVYIVSTNKDMKSVTNYFLVNLSLADTMVSTLNVIFNFISMVNSHWPFGLVYCKISNFIAILSISASVFTLTAISCDRYNAILHPLRVRMSHRHAIAWILLIWTLSAILALPNAIYSTLTEEKLATENVLYICVMIWPDGRYPTSHHDHIYNIMLFVVIYLVPIITMAILYYKVGRELWGYEAIGENVEKQRRALMAKKKIVKMMIVVVAIFALCWFPYHAFFIVNYYLPIFPEMPIQYQRCYLIMYWFAMSNSMYNPIIIYFMNSKSYRSNVASSNSQNNMVSRHCSSQFSSVKRSTICDNGQLHSQHSIMKRFTSSSSNVDGGSASGASDKRTTGTREKFNKKQSKDCSRSNIQVQSSGGGSNKCFEETTETQLTSSLACNPQPNATIAKQAVDQQRHNRDLCPPISKINESQVRSELGTTITPTSTTTSFGSGKSLAQTTVRPIKSDHEGINKAPRESQALLTNDSRAQTAVVSGPSSQLQAHRLETTTNMRPNPDRNGLTYNVATGGASGCEGQAAARRIDLVELNSSSDTSKLDTIEESLPFIMDLNGSSNTDHPEFERLGQKSWADKLIDISSKAPILSDYVTESKLNRQNGNSNNGNHNGQGDMDEDEDDEDHERNVWI